MDFITENVVFKVGFISRVVITVVEASKTVTTSSMVGVLRTIVAQIIAELGVTLIMISATTVAKKRGCPWIPH